MPVKHSVSPQRRFAPLRALALLLFIPSSIASAQRDLRDIPIPDPLAEREAMNVDPQASVNLFAADPEITKPIQMNFDSTGGLWVATSEVYPQIKPGEKANDKIVVLRDTDGDGVSDSRRVFAEGLLIPTGVVPDGPHAAYVAESTRLLYLEDTDHDGKADKRRVVLSGFGTEDTHHLVHTLRFGPDGCLYFNQSIYIHSHIETAEGTRHLDGGGIWRYRPSTGKLEVLCKGFVNPWGHALDHVGESFATDGAYFEGINYVFPDSVFVTSPGATRWLKGLNPGSPKHCGLTILSGTHVPPQWSGDLVANDFRSHRVCRFSLRPNGSSYISRQQPEIVTTQHVAFRPIDAAMGFDGALYIADWYNPIIQHGEVDFRDERRDREHGRIWRISFPERPLDPWPDFEKAPVDELLDLLEDPSLSVRQFSREELWRRAAAEEAQVLVKYQQWAGRAAATRSLELFWVYEVIGRSATESLATAIDQAIPEARRTTLRSLWRSRLNAEPQARGDLENAVLDLVNHDDPRVRLEAVICAGQLDADDYSAAVHAVLDATNHPLDPDLEFAIWQSLRNLDRSHADGSILSKLAWDHRQRQLAHAVSAIATPQSAEVAVHMLESGDLTPESIDALVPAIALAGDASQLGRVVETLASNPRNFSLARLKPLLDRTRRDRTIPTGVGAKLAEFLKQHGASEDRIETMARIAQVWRIAQLESPLRESVARTSGPLQQRVIESLGAFESSSAKQTLTKLAGDPDPSIRIAATRAIASSRPRAAINSVVDLAAGEQTADAAGEMIAGMLARNEIPELLADEIASRDLPADLARALLRRVQSAGGSPPLEAAIRSSGNLESAAWTLTPQLKEEILELVKTKGSASQGEEVYRREKLQCIKCHAIGSGGGVVGPNLISTGGSSQPDYILESLLDPSAKLKEGYTTLSVLTDESELINGIVIGKTDEFIRLRLADGKEVEVAVDSIEQQKPGKSLMPEGLLDSLTKAELVDLTTFMSAVGRDPDFTVSTEPLLRAFETLVYTNEANRRLNRTSTDTAASDDPAMQWRALTTRVNGTIPISELDEFKQHRETPPTSFIRFQLQMSGEGTAELDLPSEGIEAWVDSKPTPVWDLNKVKLGTGKHTVVLAIDRSVQTESFTVRIAGDAVEAE